MRAVSHNPKSTLAAALALALILLVAGLRSASAQDEVSVRFDFQNIRQGQVGVVYVSGANLVQGTATAFEREYQCYPISGGLACLLAAPMAQVIRAYPVAFTFYRADGTVVQRGSNISVANGGFIAEPFTLPNYLNYLLRDDIQQNEDMRLGDVYDIVTPKKYWEGTFNPPVNSPLISSFGAVRTYTNTGAVRRHTGVDLRATMGTPVLASASGRVALSRPMDIHGNNVVIDHGYGIFTEYAHLSERYVVPGQFVLQGDVIGLSGNTGRSTGPHIHWEVSVGGVVVNPLVFAGLRLPQ